MLPILKITKGNNSAKRYNFHTNHEYKIAKGHKTAKNVEGVTVHNQSLVILLFVPSFKNYLEWYQSYRADTISMPEIKKGNNSPKYVSGVTIFNLCKMTDHALHLYHVS